MRVLLTALLATAIAIAGEARAQARECSYVAEPGVVTSGSGSVVTIQGPFQVNCTDGSRVRARSGVVDQASRIVTLDGAVNFEDPMRTLTSTHAVYEINIGRLHATGDVVFLDRQEGTTLRGPELEYFRVMEGRPQALVNAPGRPHLSLSRRERPDTTAPAARPSPEAETPPLEVDANHMTIVGQDNLTATGNVVIEDPDMRATADEAEHDGATETLELRGNAAIHSAEYSLQGRTIFARIPGGSLEEVEARGRAELLGNDLEVRAPELNLLFDADLLQRSIARGDSLLAPGVQPVATSATFRLQADSIDASLPGQRLETVVAIGNARGETIDTTRADTARAMSAITLAPDSLPGGEEMEPAAVLDSLRIPGPAEADSLDAESEGSGRPPMTAAELVASDWIVGDTITGYFTSVEVSRDTTQAVEEETLLAEPGAAQDTTVVLERLVALGAAQSLYHMAPEENASADALRGINFLSAARIELIFEGGQVKVANVGGLRRGMYLEPVAAGEAPAVSAPPAGGTEEADQGQQPATMPPEGPPVEPDGERATDPAGEPASGDRTGENE